MDQDEIDRLRKIECSARMWLHEFPRSHTAWAILQGIGPEEYIGGKGKRLPEPRFIQNGKK